MLGYKRERLPFHGLKGEAIRKQPHWICVAAAVFSVAQKRMTARRKLHADLMGASRMQNDPHEGKAVLCVFFLVKHLVSEGCRLYATAHSFDDVAFVLGGILKQKVV